MSNSSLSGTIALPGLASRLNVSRLVVRPIKRLAFWSAIVLPFMHLSLLAAGLESQSMTLAFIALLALNVVTLYVGHPHGRD